MAEDRMLEARWASRGALLGAQLTTRIRQAHPLAAISVKERLICGVLLLGTAIINLFQLARSGYGNIYYAAAVRSMLESWHNFFFVSFDPGGFVTIDKPPVDFWLQALSAKLFGLNGFSLELPQSLAGIASVAVLYVLVCRIFGMLPAALAALALALSPVNVATNRDNIIDSMLALVILLAAWAEFKVVQTGKLRWLLGCAVLIGLGFNIKMLEAYLVAPAFAALYLLAAPHHLSDGASGESDLSAGDAKRDERRALHPAHRQAGDGAGRLLWQRSHPDDDRAAGDDLTR